MMRMSRSPVEEPEVEGAAGVLKDIEESAFQSGLLSLNLFLEASLRGSDASSLPAAREAARLAERCSDAASEAAVLVDASASGSAEGNPGERLAGGRLRHMQQRARVAADLVCEIAAAVAPRRAPPSGVAKD